MVPVEVDTFWGQFGQWLQTSFLELVVESSWYCQLGTAQSPSQ